MQPVWHWVYSILFHSLRLPVVWKVTGTSTSLVLFVCLFDFTDLLWKIPLVLVLITLLQVFLYENYFKLLWLADWYIQRGKIRRNDLNTIKRFDS